MKQKLILIFHGRFPSEKAASLFAAESSAAFAQEGYEVMLLVPRRRGALPGDPYDFYNVPKNFTIVYLPAFESFFAKVSRKAAFWSSYISFSVAALFHVLKHGAQEDIVFSNEILPLALVSFFRKNCFYEMHDFPESKQSLFGSVLKRMRWILVHNKWKLEEAQKLFPDIPKEKFLYEPNAVDLKTFDISMSAEEARGKLGLLAGEKFVVYTGHLYSWKGVDTLAEAALLLPAEYRVIFIGGTSEDIERFTAKYGTYKQISIMGHVPHAQIPVWQKAAHALVLPNTAKEKISALYTSPMKLFEYMASSRPIVATKIPSLCEILNDKNSILVDADDVKSLAHGIVLAVEETQMSKKITEQALKDVANHTWEKRAERISNFIKK
jgi:glycosyltransferase involved in cell wall biosynthesis